jgi:hypothetical protein
MNANYLCEAYDVLIMGKKSVEQQNIWEIHKTLKIVFSYLILYQFINF